MSLLSIEGVRKEYQVRGRRVVALESVDLDIREGEFVTIVGPSGCGKSTLLNLIVGLLRSTGGRIVFNGAAVDGICTQIGYVTQKDNLFPWRTLIENVEIALEIRGIARMSRRSQAFRNATISSWLRPTKFHHMTICSSNGSPPNKIARQP